MSLESKTKTFRELLQKYKTEKGWGITVVLMDSQWVPLMEAQKLEAENQLLKLALSSEQGWRIHFEKQIVEANKILDDYFFPVIFKDGRRGVRDQCKKESCHDCHIDKDHCLAKNKLFERLREVLK